MLRFVILGTLCPDVVMSEKEENIVDVDVTAEVLRIFTGFLQDTVTVKLGSEPVEEND